MYHASQLMHGGLPGLWGLKFYHRRARLPQDLENLETPEAHTAIVHYAVERTIDTSRLDCDRIFINALWWD